MGRRSKGSRAVAWGLFVLIGLVAAAPARADALPFWPAAPMAIATALGSGLAGMAMTRPTLVWGPSALSGKLPRVRLLPSEQQTSLLLTPPTLGARVPLTSRLPTPPGFQFENGPRQVILRPDFRMTNDRRGAYVCLRGSF